MTTRIQYYALVTSSSDGQSASGLARRSYEPGAPVDETLRRDLSWQPDSAIVEWEYGDLGTELVKISEQEAENLTQALRARWSRTPRTGDARRPS
jgi:hypothetical protein